MQGIFKFLTWDSEDLEFYLRLGWEPVDVGYPHDRYGLGVFFQCNE